MHYNEQNGNKIKVSQEIHNLSYFISLKFWNWLHLRHHCANPWGAAGFEAYGTRYHIIISFHTLSFSIIVTPASQYFGIPCCLCRQNSCLLSISHPFTTISSSTSSYKMVRFTASAIWPVYNELFLGVYHDVSDVNATLFMSWEGHHWGVCIWVILVNLGKQQYLCMFTIVMWNAYFYTVHMHNVVFLRILCFIPVTIFSAWISSWS